MITREEADKRFEIEGMRLRKWGACMFLEILRTLPRREVPPFPLHQMAAQIVMDIGESLKARYEQEMAEIAMYSEASFRPVLEKRGAEFVEECVAQVVAMMEAAGRDVIGRARALQEMTRGGNP